MEKWAKTAPSEEAGPTDKATVYKEVLTQLEDITQNLREFWEEYGPELTDEDMAEIHQMCRELELKMLMKFCNRLGE